MTKILKFLAALLIAVPVFAQAQNSFSQRELDQMLAPIALYPDPLLSQVLMAATYPRDVVEAADWSRAHPDLQGDDAVRAVADEDWDPSVKSLVASPQLLARMDEKLDWTRDLGDAFLAQEGEVMDTVQQLRRRAYDAGNLESSEQLDVQRVGASFRVLFSSPQYLYVPYYDPMVVYGSWWWPAYRPVHWSPWAGYARHRQHVAFWWGRPVRVSNNFFFGNFDWQRRHVHVVHVNNYYYRSPVIASRTVVATPGRWQHEPQHRRDVAYRDPGVRARFDAARLERRHDERRDVRRDVRLADRRDDRRNERRDERQAAPAQAQPQAPAATERRADRRDERRDERRVAPVQPQAAAQPRAEPRDDRRAERQAAMEAQRQAQQQARQAQDTQRQAQQQQARQAQEAQRQAQAAQRQARTEALPQPQARPEQRPSMPAAQAPQTPRAERHERKKEKRDERHEKREERGHKSG